MNGDVSGEHDTIRDLTPTEEQEDAALHTVHHAIEQLRALRDALVGTTTPRFTDNFLTAVQLIQQCESNGGMVITTGVGKSALNAQRLAATLNVVGAPARYMCPVAALHGDLGSVGRHDALVVVSRGGSTGELLHLTAAWATRRGIAYQSGMIPHDVILLTATEHTYLARYARVVLMYPGEEADEEGLVPTTSNTTASVLGDMVAMAVQRTSERTREDFAAVHPAGTLGRRLTLKVKDVMVTGDEVPRVHVSEFLLNALLLLADKRGTLAVEDNNGFCGVVTAGDIARWLHLPNRSLQDGVGAVVNEKPSVTTPDATVANAIEQMQAHKVMAMPVIEQKLHAGIVVLGMIHLHDALRAGVL